MKDRVAAFREHIRDFYHDHGRDLPWRHDSTPYQVFVSEVMLQQTQVSRVLQRYDRWLARFADFERLAAAGTHELLAEWQGMGYNRRALWLRESARRVVNQFGCVLPCDPAMLVTLPGIGPNTAGSIAAFAYNEPVVFIETNIRRVFIHHYRELVSDVGAKVMQTGVGSDIGFVEERDSVRQREVNITAASMGMGVVDTISDSQLRPLIEAALDRGHPREWYYALMDYGADLAKHVPNPNRRSRHYSVQTAFDGSLRQLRGEVLRQLLDGPKPMLDLKIADERLPQVLKALEQEGFITRQGDVLALAK